MILSQIFNTKNKKMLKDTTGTIAEIEMWTAYLKSSITSIILRVIIALWLDRKISSLLKDTCRVWGPRYPDSCN